MAVDDDRAETPRDRLDVGTSRRRSIVAVGAAAAVIATIAVIRPWASVGPGDETAAQRPPSAPSGLRSKVTSGRVVLDWQRASPAGLVYRVVRDGKVLAASRSKTRFVDDHVVPLGTYVYEIRAVASNGATSDAAKEIVTTTAPPVASARIAGLFNAQLHERTHYGFGGFITHPSSEWSFEPDCVRGPCDGAWRYYDYPGIVSGFASRGGRYVATARGALDIPCGSSIPTTTLALEFRVTDADVVDGQWSATRLEGTLREDTPAQFGCISAGVTYRFVATALPAAAANVVELLNEPCGFEGAGFVIGNGDVVTSAHVIAGDPSPTVRMAGRDVTARVLAFSVHSDLAVLDVGRADSDGFDLGDGSALGSPRVTAFGFPEGASLTAVDARVVRTLTLGRDMNGRTVALRGLLLRGDITHGDSGGPVVSEDGAVVGVITAGTGDGRSYAVGASAIEQILSAKSNAGQVPTGACYLAR